MTSDDQIYIDRVIEIFRQRYRKSTINGAELLEDFLTHLRLSKLKIEREKEEANGAVN